MNARRRRHAPHKSHTADAGPVGVALRLPDPPHFVRLRMRGDFASPCALCPHRIVCCALSCPDKEQQLIDSKDRATVRQTG
ncbi:unnamed protein product [Parajaminaea phylloscopi]